MHKSRPIITALYCSNAGTPVTNQEVYEQNSDVLSETLDEKASSLYEKLLLRDPQRTRHFIQPYESVTEAAAPSVRAKRFEQTALHLLTDASLGALEQLNMDATDIDLLIVNYMAGKTLPSLAARLHGALEMRVDCDVITMGDMGCSAAVAALDTAYKMLDGYTRSKRALIVSTEPVSNLFQHDNDPGAVVGNTLFGEGAAAVIMSTHQEKALFEIEAMQRVIHTDDESLNVITLATNQTGPMIQLSKDIPVVAGRAIEANLKRLVPQFLPLSDKIKFAVSKRTPKWQRHVDWWAIHPGGTAVLDGFRKQLKLSQADLGPSYQVFMERSNMSSPSALYALEHVERRGCQRNDRVMLMSFGSGFKVNAMVLKRGGRKQLISRQKTAVVIGGTSGIGLDTAKRLTNEGYKVIIGSRRIGMKDADYERLDTAIYLPLDVSDSESIKAFSQDVWRLTYGIDTLVVSSGIVESGAFVGALDAEKTSRMIDTNLSGAINIVDALLPKIRHRGSIVLMNSILGQLPLMGSAVYCASKAGLAHFARTTQLELARRGRQISIRSFYPAYVETPMLEGVKDGKKTFLKPISAARISNKIARVSKNEAGTDESVFLLTRDRLLVGLYKAVPKLYKKILATL